MAEPETTHPSLFDHYSEDGFFDEAYANGVPRAHYQGLVRRLSALTPGEFRAREELADLTLVNQGITFTVYGSDQGIEKPFPVDLCPRVVPANEWDHVEDGLIQRVKALNHFLYDVYHDQEILKAGVIPSELVINAPNFRREFIGAKVPHDIYVHICGSDLIRDENGVYRVLEDNCRTPSGVSYMLENRMLLMKVFPSLFKDNKVRPIDGYPAHLINNLRELYTGNGSNPCVVLLTPGVYNSAYFEHSFLAQQMGIELVEGRDLFTEDNFVYMKTTQGKKRVDVIYRRVDDDFLDPLTFRSDSVLGCAGLVNAYRAGNVAIANGIGTGVADDKAVYAYVPDMIRFYLKEEPILAQVDTFLGWREEDLDVMLKRTGELVIKAANESGGYGMLIGPQATNDEIEDFRKLIKANPRNYIGQPLIGLSRSPCFVENHFEGRHVDLRPYILVGKNKVTVTPGGLTRVALRKGSYVVNSSQGGGSKDTWVLFDTPEGAQSQSQSQSGQVQQQNQGGSNA